MFGFLNHKIIFFSLHSLHSLSFKPLTEVVWFVVLTVFHSLFYSCGGEAVKQRRRRLCSSDSDAGFTNEHKELVFVTVTPSTTWIYST